MFLRLTLTTLFIIIFSASFFPGFSLAGGAREADSDGGGNQEQKTLAVLDFNEETHLVFMREEEKLARDVYLKLGMLYPDSTVFGQIDDSEQRHTDTVREMLGQYELEDPSTNDNIGVYTGEAYGEYFTEKYAYLVQTASASELDALYVGAFIEELDMHDIDLCPGVIVEQDNGVDDEDQCGRLYTDQPDIITLYDALLEGSESHLRGYVRAIEAIIGDGAYTAQVLSQARVDEILDR